MGTIFKYLHVYENYLCPSPLSHKSNINGPRFKVTGHSNNESCLYLENCLKALEL